MSRIQGDTFIAEPQPVEKCELCGKVAELRPYGEHGENICFQCGMKNPEATKSVFQNLIKDVKTVIRNDTEVTVLVLPKLPEVTGHDQ